MSLTENLQPPTKQFFSSANYKTCRVFWAFDQVGSAYRTREIPAKSHMCFSVFFLKNPRNRPGTKVLNFCRNLWDAFSL